MCVSVLYCRLYLYCIAGCMAERLKAQIVEREKSVDVVCGPDAYRDLPRLLATTSSGQQAAGTVLVIIILTKNPVSLRFR